MCNVLPCHTICHILCQFTNEIAQNSLRCSINKPKPLLQTNIHCMLIITLFYLINLFDNFKSINSSYLLMFL